MRRFLLAVLLCAALYAPALGSTIWTQFNNVDLPSGTVTGTLAGTTVTYTSTDLNWAQINNLGTNWWLCGASVCPAYFAPGITPPNTVDMISINGGNVLHTISFSSPVTNPVMAFISLGQPSVFTTYYFDQPFTILQDGPGWWGGPGTLQLVSGNGLQGIEGDGLAQFNGTFSQISWTGANGEYWNGFNVGAPTPEPGTLALLGTSMLGVVGVLRQKLMR
jgi:hypothetical protein